MTTDDTIAAVASAAGGAERGIVRISGPAAVKCAAAFCNFAAATTTAASYDGAATLPGFASTVLCELFIWPGERSYTRQPTVELHLPGSPPLVAAALEAACRHGARPAGPGEFTLRAFLAGRLDLTQAEAVLGVVDAADQRQLNVALRQMAGGLAGPLDRIRNNLLDLTAHLEAGLDFVEEDIEFIARDELVRQLRAGQAAVNAVFAQTTSRGTVGERPRIVLVGLPNAGKSSLFNALLGRPDAIVSAHAGTTRDYLSAVCTFAGIECELIDTAGVDQAVGATPSIASAVQDAAAEQSHEADLRVLCIDGSRPATTWETDQLQRSDVRQLVVRTKSDLSSPAATNAGTLVSVRTGAGLDELRALLGANVVDPRETSGEIVSTTAARCRDSLARAAAALEAAATTALNRGGDELVAIELRTALDELGRVVGAVYTDDILDRIFSRFCIGK